MKLATTRERRIVGSAAIAGVIAVIAIALFLSNSDAGGRRDDMSATPGTDIQGDRTSITAVVAEFARAMDAGDGDALYAVQSQVYRAGCSRADFEAVVASVVGQKITGVVDIDIRGDLAGATIKQLLPNGLEVSRLLPLQRESDGLWKLAPPVEGRCIP